MVLCEEKDCLGLTLYHLRVAGVCALGRLACDCLCLPCEPLPISDNEETWGAARCSSPPTWSRVPLGSLMEQLPSLFPNWVPQPPLAISGLAGSGNGNFLSGLDGGCPTPLFFLIFGELSQ